MRALPASLVHPLPYTCERLIKAAPTQNILKQLINKLVAIYSVTHSWFVSWRLIAFSECSKSIFLQSKTTKKMVAGQSALKNGCLWATILCLSLVHGQHVTFYIEFIHLYLRTTFFVCGQPPDGVNGCTRDNRLHKGQPVFNVVVTP